MSPNWNQELILLEWEVLDEFINKEKKTSSRRWFILWVSSVVGLILWWKLIIENTVSDIKFDYLKERAIKSKNIFTSELQTLWLDEKVISNIVNSIVIIFTNDWLWTWFFVTSNLIITAGHVISGSDIDFSNPDKPSFIFDLNGNNYKPSKVFWDTTNDLWWILVSEKWKWKLDVFNTDFQDWKRISLWFWGKPAHVTEWNKVEWFRNIDFQEVIKWKSNLDFITNWVAPWDSWWPIIDINWNLVWVTVVQVSPDYKIYDNNRYPWVPFHVNLRYWWVESLEDIRTFVEEL